MKTQRSSAALRWDARDSGSPAESPLHPAPGSASPELHARCSVAQALAPIESLCQRSVGLVAGHLQLRDAAGGSFYLPRYLFVGPQGGAEPIRVGLFGGIHGDEPAGVGGLVRFLSLIEAQPRLAKGYILFVYPVCNPTGFEDRTRLSRTGHDLNRSFWQGSKEPEIVALEHEIVENRLQGIIALHSDDTSDGFYGYARGSLLTRQLMEPALAAAEEVLPRNRQPFIDGFHARDGVITDCFEGVLAARPNTRPRPFEIILESPDQAPQFHQELAFAASLRAILEEYRRFIACAANL